MRNLLGSVGIVLCIGCISVYSFRPDWAISLTFVPAFFLLPLFVLPWIAKARLLRLIAALVSASFVALHVEESASLLRSFLPRPTLADCRLVISLNASGSVQAVYDALTLEPSAILLQESPRKDLLENCLVQFPDYRLAYGVDSSIVVRGEITDVQRGGRHTSARTRFGSASVELVSLRLQTSQLTGLGLAGWSRTRNRSLRESQRESLTAICSGLPATGPVILGGDFNVPAGDPVFRPLKSGFVDAFAGASRGWPNTVTQASPVHRIDQIWLRNWICILLQSRDVRGTDHRMVLAWVKPSL